MTPKALVDFVRLLLHDTGASKATLKASDDSPSFFFEDDEIEQQLIVAREQVLRELLARRRQLNLSLSISKSLDQVAATAGTQTGADFLALECGLDTNSLFASTGIYIPAADTPIGIAFDSVPYPQLYVGGGFYQGNAGVGVIWKAFDEAIVATDDTTVFTQGNESFYYTVAFYAARELVSAERGGADDRWDFFNANYQRRLMSLQ